MKESGFDEKDIEKVHAPIGLHIHAETPQEIAVSIVAELIKIRGEK
jgi:xanthine dehydrogenase accessory factor